MEEIENSNIETETDDIIEIMELSKIIFENHKSLKLIMMNIPYVDSKLLTQNLITENQLVSSNYIEHCKIESIQMKKTIELLSETLENNKKNTNCKIS